jgi:hypothetical protein
LLSLSNWGSALDIVPSPPPITIKSASLPSAFSFRFRSFLELDTTMTASQRSVNQDDSAGNVASALDAPGVDHYQNA